MKVIIIGSAYPLRGGGITTFNERLAKAFADANHEVAIYSFSLQYPSIFFPGKTQYSEDTPPENLDIRVKINSINPFNWYKVGKEIRKLQPDLVVVRYWIPFMAPCLGTICRKIRKNKKTRIVAITDNIIPHEKFPFAKLLTRYFVKSCDAFVTMSKAVLNDLNRFDQKKPRTYHPHPLYDNYGDPVEKQTAKRHLNLKETSRYILFFGLIRPYKGLDLLLKAFADESVKKLGLKLIVAGEFYVDQKPYLDIIEQNNLHDSVLLHTHFIPNSQVADYFCAADLVVQPYKDATQSGVTQIAYHFNKPMVVTNVGGLPELVPDGKVGFVVNPDIHEISNAILRFYTENREQEFSENMNQEKQKFSWESLLETLLSEKLNVEN